MTGQNPRLRVLYIGEGQQVLIVDRLGEAMTPITWQKAEALLGSTKASGAFAGSLIFPFEVDVPVIDDPDPDDEGVRLHVDELEAIERLHAVHHGAVGADFRQSDMHALRLLVERAREARS